MNAKQAAQYYKMMQEQMKDAVVCTMNMGRMDYDEVTRKVHARPARGKIVVRKSPHERGMIDFEWSERNSTRKDWQRKIIQNLASWERVGDCEDGRVYALKINQSNPYFFWSQEVEEEKDIENGKKIMKAIKPDENNENAAPAPADNNNLGNALQAAFANMPGINASQQPAASNQPVQPQDAANQFAALFQQQSQRAQQMRELAENDPSINDIFPSSREELEVIVDTLIANEDFMNTINESLPEGQRSRDDIIDHILSPQFRGAARRLSQVLQSGEGAILYSEMGLDSANMQPGVRAFLEAIERTHGPDDEEGDDKEMS